MEKRRERMKGGWRRWGEEWCVEEKRMAWGEQLLCGRRGRRGRRRMESVWRCGGMEVVCKIKELRSKIPRVQVQGICFIGVRVQEFWGCSAVRGAGVFGSAVR